MSRHVQGKGFGPSIEWQSLPIVGDRRRRMRLGADHALSGAVGFALALLIAVLAR